MVRLVQALLVTLLLACAAVADDRIGSVSAWPLWGVAFLNFYLTGWLLGWLLAKLTPDWDPPAFFWKWFDFLKRPEDRQQAGDA